MTNATASSTRLPRKRNVRKPFMCPLLIGLAHKVAGEESCELSVVSCTLRVTSFERGADGRRVELGNCELLDFDPDFGPPALARGSIAQLGRTACVPFRMAQPGHSHLSCSVA